ncbi:PepSY domain-containing protein [Photobacterium sp. MCCC 1A19761]|uniref:PepSY domain-containing protein n=1 Tax=Photobacterium sp. MCCC 1A19761 TaxID=3115000 RepID=UPI00307D60D5
MSPGGLAAPSVDISEDQDEVIEAVQQGRVQPYTALQLVVSQQLNGRIIKVELEQDDDQWVYELKLIDPENNIIKVKYDASSLTMIEIKGRHLENIIKVAE